MTSTKEGKVISSILSWSTRLTLALNPQWSQDCLEACWVWSLLDWLNISPKAQWILHTRPSLIFLPPPPLLLQLAALLVAFFLLLWFVTLLQAWGCGSMLVCILLPTQEVRVQHFYLNLTQYSVQAPLPKHRLDWLNQKPFQPSLLTLCLLYRCSESSFRLDLCATAQMSLPPWDCVYTAALLRHWWFWLQSGLHPDILVWLVWGSNSPYRECSLLEGSHVF